MSPERLHPLPMDGTPTDGTPTDGTPTDGTPTDGMPTDWYEGRDPHSGQLYRLPRTGLAEGIARHLMAQLVLETGQGREGKMYGILLVETQGGDRRWLKAFSGLLAGRAEWPGWVPPIPGRDRVALQEAQTLAQLAALKQSLIALQTLPERAQYRRLSEQFLHQRQALAQVHCQRKAERHRQRQRLKAELLSQTPPSASPPFSTRHPHEDALDDQSRRDGIERRNLKRSQDAALAPLAAAIAQADERMGQIKRRRKALSQQLQADLQAAYHLNNFAGTVLSLSQVSGQMSGQTTGPKSPGGAVGLPTGTGECCAPKLLHYAASQGLKPLALAEFWWGDSVGGRVQGAFYGACPERCQPLMGFLLGGLAHLTETAAASASEQDSQRHGEQCDIKPFPSLDLSLTLLYEDDWLIAVDKPAGLLSVPGRSRDRQDSVLSRLRNQLQDASGRPLGERLQAVHRLDQDTSGILLLAKDPDSYRHLQKQFQQQQVHKTYAAVLQGTLLLQAGHIDLPLAPDPAHRPKQRVDRERGKPSFTRFRLLDRHDTTSRVCFEPTTGRTHQLRVHAAVGLGMPIVGDRLYGDPRSGDREASGRPNRLHLHAQQLRFTHPYHQREWLLNAPAPF